MASTLDTLRALVRELLDDVSTDVEEHRWKTTEVDFALEASLEGVLLSLGPLTDRFDHPVEVTVPGAGVSLAAEKPLLIKSVEARFGRVYIPISGAPRTGASWAEAEGDVRVTLVPKPTFPTTGSATLDLGPGLLFLDRLVCLEAAAMLTPKDAEGNRELEHERARAYATAQSYLTVAPMAREMGAVAATALESRYFGGTGVYDLRWTYNVRTQNLGLVR